MRRGAALALGLAAMAAAAGAGRVAMPPEVVSETREDVAQRSSEPLTRQIDARAVRAPRPRAAITDRGLVAPDPLVRRVVHVVDACGDPVAGVDVRGHESSVEETTGEDGRATFRYPRDAEGARVDVDDGWGVRVVELTEPETEVVVAFPRLEVVGVEARTGAPVGLVRAVDDRTGDDEDVDVLDAEHPAHVRLRRFGEGRVRIAAVPPAGRAVLGDLEWEGTVAPQARRVRFTVPVWPETTRTVRPVDEAGNLLAGVGLEYVDVIAADEAEVVPWSSPRVRVERCEDGSLVLAELPAVPANLLRVTLSREPGPGGADGRRGSLLVRPLAQASDAAVDVECRSWDGTWRGTASGGWSSGSRCRGGRVPTLVVVRVVAVRADGTPAPHVEVLSTWASARTGADGAAELVTAARDRVVVRAASHGFRPAAAVIRPDAGATVVLREPPPRVARVRVVDEDGAPVPGARVLATATCVPGPAGEDLHVSVGLAQMDGDVELLTPRTGPDGVVTLDVCEGEVRYDVTLGGAVGRAASRDDEVVVRLATPVPAD